MGPFSNNPTPSHQPRGGTKLPVPAVDSPSLSIDVLPEPDHHDGFRRWLTVTLVLVGVTVVAAVGVIAANVYFSNTPQALLGSALQDAVEGGLAGEYVYSFTQGQKPATLRGDFLAYPDPTNSQQRYASLSVGQGDTRLGIETLGVGNSVYSRVSGMANARRLVESYQGDATALTPDYLAQLAVLDGQWFVTNNQLSQSGLKQLTQLYMDHQFLTVAQQYADATINNVQTANFKLTVDNEKLGGFVQAVKAANIEGVSIDGVQLQGDVSAEVWISRSDRAFQQVKLTAGGRTLLLALHPDAIATQQQSVVQPDGAQPIDTLVRGLQSVFSPKP